MLVMFLVHSYRKRLVELHIAGLELSIPVEEKIVPFDSGSNWDAFRNFSPVGKVPCLHDGAVVLWD